MKCPSKVCKNCWRWERFKKSCDYFWEGKRECSKFKFGPETNSKYKMCEEDKEIKDTLELYFNNKKNRIVL